MLVGVALGDVRVRHSSFIASSLHVAETHAKQINSMGYLMK